MTPHVDRSETQAYRTALESIVRLWTHPAPAQRQDVAFQKAVRIAADALHGAPRLDERQDH